MKTRYVFRHALALFFFALLAACSEPNSGALINDPYEKLNRGVHGFNKGLDRGIARPAAKVYDVVFTEKDDEVIQNWGRTISLPNRIANQLLQGRFGAAFNSSLRLTTNLTLGFFGSADVATELGLPDNSTDFGETLHVWGFREGNYVELPVFGASNERDAVGRVVDIFLLDPLGFEFPSTKPVTFSVEILEQIGTRNAFSDLIDEVLYNSEDSYLAQQLAYTQNRRFRLSQTDGVSLSEEILLEDPFEDF